VAATSGGGTLSYAYDADGNMHTAADGAGTTTYAYNALDQLTSMTDPTGVAWQFAYNKAGQRTRAYYNATTPNNPSSYGAEEQTGYDSAGRITSITATGNSGAATLASTAYCYSPYVSGQACPTSSASTDTELLRWAKNQQTGVVTPYTYDSGNRLKTVTPTRLWMIPERTAVS
jgi:YD repeat-containing protein